MDHFTDEFLPPESHDTEAYQPPQELDVDFHASGLLPDANPPDLRLFSSHHDGHYDSLQIGPGAHEVLHTGTELALDTDGDGRADLYLFDTDHDGRWDEIDRDADQDGHPEQAWFDTNHDGTFETHRVTDATFVDGHYHWEQVDPQGRGAINPQLVGGLAGVDLRTDSSHIDEPARNLNASTASAGTAQSHVPPHDTGDNEQLHWR